MSVKLTAAGVAHLREHPGDAEVLRRMASSFREFLNYWHFLDQDTGEDRVLGEVLWPAQEEFIRVAERYWWVFYLKARQLGETTIECAFDAWVMRFRDPNARVHVFSKRDDEACELLERVKYGLRRLPEWLQLPVSKNTVHEYELDAGEDDRRLCKAYPADKNPSRSATCSHAHVDEWAFTGDPKRIWAAIEPGAAGTVHFLTTGDGPQNYSSIFWRRCLAGDVLDRRGDPVHPCFIGALERPDRTAAWLKAKRAGMDELEFKREYALTWEDALFGGGEFVFTPRDLDRAAVDFRGLAPSRPGHRYVKGWDVGRHQDAAVGVVLDVTEDVHDVVAYVRLRGVRYPDIQREIENTHRAYPGLTAIEKNAAGEAVLENLNLPEHELEGFSTTGSSKPRIIQGLVVQLQGWLLKWDPETCSQLDAEMRGYQLPDDGVVQDSVIALAIAEEYSGQAQAVGRVRKVITA